MRIIKVIIDLVGFRYSKILVCVLTIIVGFTLAHKKENDSSVRKAIGCILPVLIVGIQYFSPRFTVLAKSKIVFMAASVLIYIICLVMLVISLKMFSGYSPERWVIGIFVVMTAVYLLKSYYQGQILYGFGNLMSLTSGTSGFFMAFMNNAPAMNAAEVLCTYVPPVAVFIDGFSSVNK
jgi:hypothetical protein